MDSSTIASIIIAIIAGLASTVSLYFTYYTTRRSEERASQAEVNKQLIKYSQPLLIAAFDLQARLYELVDIPISSYALECEEGREDFYKLTCYRLARFLACSYILRETTHFLSMRPSSNDGTELRSWPRRRTQKQPPPRDEEKTTTPSAPKRCSPRTLALDQSTSLLRDLLYKIDDELDRRRDAEGRNYGVFPSSRLLISERMLIRPNDTSSSSSSSEKPSSSSEISSSDIQIKDYTTFLAEYDTLFAPPLTWFLTWLSDHLGYRQNGHLKNPKTSPRTLFPLEWRPDDHLRCLQHLLCDLVKYCDLRDVYNEQGAGAYPKCGRSLECDCRDCGDEPVGNRHKSRMGDRDLSED